MIEISDTAQAHENYDDSNAKLYKESENCTEVRLQGYAKRVKQSRSLFTRLP